MDSGYAATGSEREMFDTNCLLGQRLFFARLDRIVWAEKCFYKMPNVLVLVVKKKVMILFCFGLRGLPTGEEAPPWLTKVMGRVFCRSSGDLMMCPRCSGAEYGTLDLVGV